MPARTVLFLLGTLAALALFAFGMIALIGGISEQYAANNTYVVTIATPGDDCGANQVAFDVGGNVLDCTNPALTPTDPTARFPGFSDAQDQQITDLAQQLGAGNNLDETRLATIQQQVDKIAATVPDDKKPHYDEGVSVEPLWGTWLAVVGGLMVASSIAWYVYGMRRHRRR